MKADLELDAASAMEAPRLGEPYLLTPGPADHGVCGQGGRCCSDWGSLGRRVPRHDGTRCRAETAFCAMLGAGAEAFDCVPVQGSRLITRLRPCWATAAAPRRQDVLVLANGAYGLRMPRQPCTISGRAHDRPAGQGRLPAAPRAARWPQHSAADDPAITHVLAVHCETSSSGILNPDE